jgi:hypothetical protein
VWFVIEFSFRIIFLTVIFNYLLHFFVKSKPVIASDKATPRTSKHHIDPVYHNRLQLKYSENLMSTKKMHKTFSNGCLTVGTYADICTRVECTRVSLISQGVIVIYDALY